MKRLNYRNFKIGSVISLIIGISLISFSFIIGKANFFLMMNNDFGTLSDYFFLGCTALGNGWIWLAVLIILFLINRRDALPLCISAFVLSTVLTQICKYFIVPDEARPWKAITDHLQIHYIKSYEPLLISSFPSGHTATAFTIYLFFCLLIYKHWWLIAGLLYALLVGYSRVYLAQHFPFDIGAGIIIGFVSVLLSIPVQKLWMKRSNKK